MKIRTKRLSFQDDGATFHLRTRLKIVRSMSCKYSRRGWNALYGSPSCPGAESWHKLTALESTEAEKRSVEIPGETFAVRPKNLLIIDRKKKSCPPDEATDEKCVLQWSLARPEPTDAERQSIKAWGVRRLSGSRKHLRIRLAQAWGSWVLPRSPESAAGRADQKVEVKPTGEESVVFGQIRPSKVSPRCVASNQCMEASVGPPSWIASVARNLREPRVN